jgi:hypothetical protein
MLGRFASAVTALFTAAAFAATGDPQVKSDHPWYPGELSSSTFERLFKTQAELYKRTTGRDVSTDEDKALASWYWRNLNVAHATEGVCDYLGKGFKQSDINREYWRGLYAHGYSLCFTTHSQYCAEIQQLLGHNRARAVGVPGHTSFEVYLTGGAYGEGRWVLLDHDVSTVIFHEDGSRLLSIREIDAEREKYSNPRFKPERQRGWRVAGLHDKDAEVYDEFKNVSYLFGYSGPPPMVNLRAGESLRRFINPGLPGQPGLAEPLYVYWGLNFMCKGVPGPERSRTWVNQPEKMYKSVKGTGWIQGQSRYGNAVYTYKPDFASSAYKEGVVDESDKHVTFEFYTPYIVGAMPPDLKAEKPGQWTIYESGCRNGLVLKGKMTCGVKVSIDQGKTWSEPTAASDGMDLTDIVKGNNQYWIRFEAPPAELAGKDLVMTTVCQCSQTVIPRLKEGTNKITFLSSGLAVEPCGPTMAQVEKHVVDGKIGTGTVTLELATPRKEPAVRLYAAAHVASGSPPKPEIAYQIEYSTDGGTNWKHIVKDWKILRRGDEPNDFWSQSMCWGDIALEDVTGPVRVRFSNSGNRTYVKCEAALVYKVPTTAPVDVTFAFREGAAGEVKTQTHTFAARPGVEETWELDAGKTPETMWVDYTVK